MGTQVKLSAKDAGWAQKFLTLSITHPNITTQLFVHLTSTTSLVLHKVLLGDLSLSVAHV